jgi:sec-independent protein translocase protein TatC
VLTGVANPLLLQLKLCALAAEVLGSPFWLYQIWAFVVPGLHPHEKRWTRVFAVVAGPLFLVGVGFGYYVLPKGIEVLVGFTPADLQNLVGSATLPLPHRMLLFGIAFRSAVRGDAQPGRGGLRQQLGAHRPWIVVGTFVFAAVATPSTDPFSMLKWPADDILFFVSEMIARLVDRRRAPVAEGHLHGLGDDETSALDHDREQFRPSRLDAEDD